MDQEGNNPVQPQTPATAQTEPVQPAVDTPAVAAAAQPAAQNPGRNLPPIISWQASEYAAHEHGALWYIGIVLATAVLAGISILILKEWLGAVVVVLMMSALFVTAHRSPRSLQYSLNEAGISVGEKFFPYSQFRSFAIMPDQAFYTLELDPLKRFMPRLSVFLEQKDQAPVSELLEKHLPKADRKPDTIDRLSHKLKL